MRKYQKKEASDKGWQFERIKGDIGLLKRFIDGDWNSEDFLIVNLGEKITATYDGGIIDKMRL